MPADVERTGFLPEGEAGVPGDVDDGDWKVEVEAAAERDGSDRIGFGWIGGIGRIHILSLRRLCYSVSIGHYDQLYREIIRDRLTRSRSSSIRRRMSFREKVSSCDLFFGDDESLSRQTCGIRDARTAFSLPTYV